MVANNDVSVDDLGLGADFLKVARIAVQTKLFDDCCVRCFFLLVDSLHFYDNFLVNYLNLKLLMAETKVTPLYVKTVAQKFDFKTIFLLDLSKRNITAIGSV